VKYSLILIILFAFSSTANSSDEANANRLFVTLVQDKKESFLILENNISPKKMTNKQLESSISVMEDTVQTLQEIVDNYPGSNLALKISTGQKLGWFFPNQPYDKLVEMKVESGVRKCSQRYERQCMFELIETLGLRAASVEDKTKYDGQRAFIYFHLEQFSQAEAILKDLDFEQLSDRNIEGLAILAAKFLSQQQAEQIFSQLPETVYEQMGYARLLRDITGGNYKTVSSDIYEMMQGFDPMGHFDEESYYEMMVKSALVVGSTSDALHYISMLDSEKSRNSMQSELAVYYAKHDLFENALDLIIQLKRGSYSRQKVIYLFSSKLTSQEVPENVIELIVDESSYAISEGRTRSRWAWSEIVSKLPSTPSLMRVQKKLVANLEPVNSDRANIFLPIGIVPKYKQGRSKGDYVSMIKARVDATDHSAADKNYTIAEVCFTIESDECAVKYLEKMLRSLSYSRSSYYQYARGFIMARLLQQKRLAQDFLDSFLRTSIKIKGATKPVKTIMGFMEFADRGELF